jgi:hypothetical protein
MEVSTPSSTTVVQVEFDAVGDRTRMITTHHGIDSDSAGATGWAMAFDKLDSHLLVER